MNLPLLFRTATVGACILLSCTTARAAELAGNASLTTDYVWRGTTQTQGDPAVQAGFKLAGASGVYASVWGSNVEFAPELHASSELDFTLGWAGAISDSLVLDVNAVHYRYPATTSSLDWTELNASLAWKARYWLSLGWSPEALGGEKGGTYAQVGARFPFNDALRVEATAGHYFLDDVYDESYTHAQLSAIWTLHANSKPIELRLTAHDTDSRAARIFGDHLAGSRIEAAVQANF